MPYRIMLLLFVVAALLWIPGRPLRADDSDVSRQYSIDVRLFSLVPGEGIDSYRDYGGGGASGPNATLGLFANDERKFSLTVETKLRSKKRVTTVRVEPKSSDSQTKPLEREFDLTDLQPRNIELARGEDGRVYRLQLLPGIKVTPQPRRLDVDDLRLNYWSFPNCPVILNDQDYIGRLAMSSGQLAYISVPSFAKIEFSLVPFRDAKPIGSLKNGVITITHDSGASLTISDVLNGVHREVLTGGPYRVFVRWSDSEVSKAEYRQQLEQNIADIKQRLANGELDDGGQKWLERMQRVLDSDRVMMMSNGLGPIPKEDRIAK